MVDSSGDSSARRHAARRVLANVFDVEPPGTELDADTWVADSASTSPGPRVDVYELRTQEEWQAFYNFFSRRRKGEYLDPWRRCISILRGLTAKTAVVENHYVCMDWRSELGAYYAHLDAPRNNFVKRLHFFATSVDQNDLLSLTAAQRNSYLGYIVLRDTDLPMIGRTVLALPRYMRDESVLTTAVWEPVHFLGQDLRVLGVPFMQQDSRFAVCAHIVTWIAHYTAFRRGTVPRRFIADFVSRASSDTTLNPGQREGLDLSQVVELFGRMGMRSQRYDNVFSDSNLPEIDGSVFGDLVERIRQRLPVLEHVNVADLTAAVEEKLLEHLNSVLDQYDDPLLNTDEHVLAYEEVLSHFVRPYIESGFPGYLDAGDHAYALVGIGAPGRQGYFIHDDQSGPYLFVDSLVAISKQDLKYQTGGPRSPGALAQMPLPPRDRTGRRIDTKRVVDALYLEEGVRSILMSAPKRAVLACHAALSEATKSVADFDGINDDDSIVADHSFRSVPRCTLLMGVDYKSRRRVPIDASRSPTHVYPTLHLAEWVVVVEGIDASTHVTWEFVFDATSSPALPRLQCARLGTLFMAIDPLEPDRPYWVDLAEAAVQPLVVPPRVGKISG